MVIRVNLFGTPRCWKDGEERPIRRRNGTAIMAYLAVLGQPTSREALATLLWPEKAQSDALQSLRRELNRLKKDVGPDLISADRKNIVFNAIYHGAVDVVQFDECIEKVQEHGHFPQEHCTVCLEALTLAITLYTADFMAGFNLPDSREFDEWQYFQREGLRQKLSGALKKLVQWHNGQQEYDQAIPYGRQWVALDPLQEAAQRELMRLYALAGQRSQAIRQYHICAQTLETELGVEPEAETKALLEAVQNQEIGPPTTTAIDLEQTVEAAANTAPIRRHNLPWLPDSFIGRSEEIEKIHHYLLETDCRLLTVRGMGGIGKSRLALEAVGKLVETDQFSDGLFFVPLAGVERVDYLVSAIAEAIQFPMSQADAPLEQLINYLRGRQMLLLLDNFEHLANGADQMSRLLQHCPHLKLLVTSRHQLNVQGEHLLVLGGLPVMTSQSPNNSAIRLFEERAIQLAPQLDLKQQAPFIQEICQLVKGLPLAIEMCAAWIQTLSCQEILAEVRQGLDLLETEQADAPGRHKSIRALFQSSFNLLNPPEQQALLALSVFRGSFNHGAAQEVAGASIIQLRRLVGKSLLGTYGETAEKRYQLHPLLYQFARETLESEQRQEAEQRHAHYFANLSAQQVKKRCTPDNQEIVPVISVEKDNFRYAWQWIGRQITGGRDPESLCRLVEQILPIWSYVYICDTQFLDAKQLLHDVRQVMVEAHWKTAGSPQQQTTLAKVTAVLARFHLELSQYDQTVRYCQESLSLFQSQSDAHEQSGHPYHSDILCTWARADTRLGNFAEAEQRLGESLRLATDDNRRADVLHASGNLSSIKGEYDSALQAYKEALHLFEKCFEQRRVLNCLLSIGTVYGRQRQFEKAMTYYEQVVPLARQTDQKVALMASLSNLAFCLRELGHTRQTSAYFEEALAIAAELGKKRWQSVIAQDFGVYLLEQGDSGKAAQYLQEGLRLAILLNSQPDILAGLLAFVQWQAQAGNFDQALLVAGYVMADKVATAETRGYAADFWEALSSELPAIFTQRAETRLKTATLDDILAQISV